MKYIVRIFEDRKWATYFLLTFLITCYLSPFLTGNIYLMASSLLGTIFIPFLMLVLWVTNNDLYSRATKPLWVKSAISVFLIFYSAKSNIYAADIINEVFLVNSGLFPITTVFLTLVYFVVIYFKLIVTIPYITSLVFGGIVLVGVFVLSKSLVLGASRAFRVIVFLFFLSATNSSINNLETYLPQIVEQVAVNSDFSKKHRCINLYDSTVESVVFMPNGKVFAYHGRSDSSPFTIEECQINEKKSTGA